MVITDGERIELKNVTELRYHLVSKCSLFKTVVNVGLLTMVSGIIGGMEIVKLRTNVNVRTETTELGKVDQWPMMSILLGIQVSISNIISVSIEYLILWKLVYISTFSFYIDSDCRNMACDLEQDCCWGNQTCSAGWCGM